MSEPEATLETQICAYLLAQEGGAIFKIDGNVIHANLRICAEERGCIIKIVGNMLHTFIHMGPSPEDLEEFGEALESLEGEGDFSHRVFVTEADGVIWRQDLPLLPGSLEETLAIWKAVAEEDAEVLSVMIATYSPSSTKVIFTASGHPIVNLTLH